MKLKGEDIALGVFLGLCILLEIVVAVGLWEYKQ